MRHPLTRLLAMTIALVAGVASGQENLPMGPSNYEHDFQLFAPFDLDLDNMSEDQWSGYFFEYNKLFWSYSGERVLVGNPDVDDTITLLNVATQQFVTYTGEGMFAEVIHRPNPQDDLDGGDIYGVGTVPPPPPLLQNTLKDVPPKAGFALGNRYEFGYMDQGHGWQVGILDGPELNQTEFYGFARRADGGLPPFIDDDYTDGDDIGPGGGPVGEARAFGFGSVPIIFETPPGYLLGFRDYVQNLAPVHQGTVAGPLLYVGNYGIPVFSEGDAIDDDVLFRRADDLDGDGIWGDVLIVTPDGIGHIVDWDDLHKFNIFFDNVLIRNQTETDGVELMWTHHLTNNHYMAKHQNNRVSISAGARFLRMYDQFRVDAEGSILHDAFWDTSFTNQIVGPQVGIQWANQRQRWRLTADGRFMFGYNVADWDQIGLMGEGSIPGALNQLLYHRPTAFTHGLREEEFSPVAELRLMASYHVFEKAALKFGYTGSFVGNIHRAAPSVNYRLPDMGYKNAGTQDLLINGFDLGVEFVY